MVRKKLPNRREAENFGIHDDSGQEIAVVRIGRYPKTGKIGEVFFSARSKIGSERDSYLYDCGVILSFAIQHGANLHEIAQSISRQEDGQAASLIGKALDIIIAADLSAEREPAVVG